MGVPPEIVEDLRGAGEGPLRIDDPVDVVEPAEEGGAGTVIGEIAGASRERQLMGIEGSSQTGKILRAKDR